LAPGNDEPLYIFGESDGAFVSVGTESGKVTHLQQRSRMSLQTRTATDGSESMRLCTASGLAYKAYRRPYLFGGTVLTLLASGYYDSAPWELFFVPAGGASNKFQLMEKVPQRFFLLSTYYSPSWCSQYGLEDLGEVVTIEDSFGEHQIRVEDLGK
ncbi:MAG TPA: hypothetical protein VHX68_16340, partial [Planctomycetaceae bacterium]|nr:hypothetical protein [Planctomycetaceae bacterium]